MTTEKTPPPGKVWVTVEVDQDDWDSVSRIDIWDLDHIKEERGEDEEDPSDKFNRLLVNAEKFFREAADGFHPTRRMDGTGPMALVHGCQELAAALKVFREDL